MTIKTPALAEETVGSDESAVAAEFVEFLKATSTKHHPTGTVPRFNQGRAAGCVDAEFVVRVSASSLNRAPTRRGFDLRTRHRSRTRSETFEACRSRFRASTART